jgi:hypothetical protein
MLETVLSVWQAKLESRFALLAAEPCVAAPEALGVQGNHTKDEEGNRIAFFEPALVRMLSSYLAERTSEVCFAQLAGNQSTDIACGAS